MRRPVVRVSTDAAVSGFFLEKNVRTYYVIEDQDRFFVAYDNHNGEARIVSESRSQQLAFALADKLNAPKGQARPKYQHGNRYLRQFQDQ